MRPEFEIICRVIMMKKNQKKGMISSIGMAVSILKCNTTAQLSEFLRHGLGWGSKT